MFGYSQSRSGHVRILTEQVRTFSDTHRAGQDMFGYSRSRSGHVRILTEQVRTCSDTHRAGQPLCELLVLLKTFRIQNFLVSSSVSGLSNSGSTIVAEFFWHLRPYPDNNKSFRINNSGEKPPQDSGYLLCFTFFAEVVLIVRLLRVLN